jgi:hypothetical protein
MCRVGKAKSSFRKSAQETLRDLPAITHDKQQLTGVSNT